MSPCVTAYTRAQYSRSPTCLTALGRLRLSSAGNWPWLSDAAMTSGHRNGCTGHLRNEYAYITVEGGRLLGLEPPHWNSH